MAKRLVNRKIRSWACANIILDLGLAEFRAFCVAHPKVKSNYRLANLFLLHKKKLYHIVEKPISHINCDNFLDYYYA